MNNPAMHGVRLTLADYLTAVKMTVDSVFDHEVWVQAELRSVSTKGGHYYFELAQKDDDDRIVASCRATLWRSSASKVKIFESITGQTLSAGLAVLMKGAASFHPIYGFSFNITDIDARFTLGALAQRYEAMINKLAQKGLLELNRALPTPFDIRRVLVLAPNNAAGLGDFRSDADRLAQVGVCQFDYHFATFQGNHAAGEIREALIKAMADYERDGILPDLIVVIRGGGAVGDLAYLNDYELAALLAEQPVPVWVGVGHERDRVLLDEVAHKSFDTPSKVILGIESLVANRWLSAKDFFERIQKNSKSALSLARKDSEHALMRVRNAASTQIKSAQEALQHLITHTKRSSYLQLTQAKERSQHLQSLILIQHPQRILQQGYAIVRQDGKVVSSARTTGLVDIEFADGVVNAVIDHAGHSPTDI